jgi:hypothetical protein
LADELINAKRRWKYSGSDVHRIAAAKGSGVLVDWCPRRSNARYTILTAYSPTNTLVIRRQLHPLSRRFALISLNRSSNRKNRHTNIANIVVTYRSAPKHFSAPFSFVSAPHPRCTTVKIRLCRWSNMGCSPQTSPGTTVLSHKYIRFSLAFAELPLDRIYSVVSFYLRPAILVSSVGPKPTT